MISLSVFLPAYNESECIEKSVLESISVLEGITSDWELIVVDDGSTDNTSQILKNLASEYPKLNVVCLSENSGYGNALRIGWSKCSKEIVFYTDSDIPIDMNDIKKGIPLMEKYDIVIGYRIDRNETFLRAVYSRIYNLVVRCLFSVKFRDINFSYKMIRREALQKIKLGSSRGVFIDGEFLAEAVRNNFRITEIPIEYTARTTGKATLGHPKVVLRTIGEIYRYWKFRTLDK